MKDTAGAFSCCICSCARLSSNYKVASGNFSHILATACKSQKIVSVHVLVFAAPYGSGSHCKFVSKHSRTNMSSCQM